MARFSNIVNSSVSGIWFENSFSCLMLSGVHSDFSKFVNLHVPLILAGCGHPCLPVNKPEQTASGMHGFQVFYFLPDMLFFSSLDVIARICPHISCTLSSQPCQANPWQNRTTVLGLLYECHSSNAFPSYSFLLTLHRYPLINCKLFVPHSFFLRKRIFSLPATHLLVLSSCFSFLVSSFSSRFTYYVLLPPYLFLLCSSGTNPLFILQCSSFTIPTAVYSFFIEPQKSAQNPFRSGCDRESSSFPSTLNLRSSITNRKFSTLLFVFFSIRGTNLVTEGYTCLQGTYYLKKFCILNFTGFWPILLSVHVFCCTWGALNPLLKR